MATVSLKNIQKIYPNTAEDTKKKKKKDDDAPKRKSNLKITEEGVVAVDSFNLEIADKEFIVLVGPSGCGKSTTLRMVAGLEDITRGDLFIDGKRMNDVAPKDRDIAMVFQNYALYPHMTVRQNLQFPLELRHVPKDVMDKKVNEAAEILGITEYLDRKPKALSGGQRQRVAIGRAIVRDPKVLLMDEPLSNLDAKLRNQMRAEIIKLRQRIDTTFIYVTHDQTEAMTLGDRIVIMKDGEIQQIGTPQEVFNKPVNLFVAGFIGMPQMNFYAGKLLLKDGRYVISVQGAEIIPSEDKQER
ncbi:MAG: ATP-binding cassette domain-containing protein, partial [Solobacterium sp.]|nr:ATP-binding cassette domain-containing protein [Solobacterium sp.]